MLKINANNSAYNFEQFLFKDQSQNYSKHGEFITYFKFFILFCDQKFMKKTANDSVSSPCMLLRASRFPLRCLFNHFT